MAEAESSYLVLGASAGVGHSLVRLLAPDHAMVAVARRPPEFEGALGRVLSLACDVREQAQVDQLFRGLSVGRVRAVVNCVGLGYYAPVDGPHAAYWEDILRTNVLGLLNVWSALVRFQPRCRHFVQVGSIAAHRPPTAPGATVYAATKAAALPLLEHFRAQAREAGLPTKVCLVSPGFIRGTGFCQHYFDPEPGAARDLFAGVASLTPEQVARVIRDVVLSEDNVERTEIILRPVD